MRLPLRTREINQLQLRHYDIVGLIKVNLCHIKREYAMAATTGAVETVRSHHLVAQAFPKIAERIFLVVALELVHVLDRDGAVRCHLDLEAGHSVGESLRRRKPILRCVQQVKHPLIVQLYVLHGNVYFVFGCLAFRLNLPEQLANAPRYHAFLSCRRA